MEPKCYVKSIAEYMQEWSALSERECFLLLAGLQQEQQLTEISRPQLHCDFQQRILIDNDRAVKIEALRRLLAK